uniref:Uncharacterized protein n=1 Tax=viral metagenome TaxID=1070528 RepID=A0A6C0DL99_9ZZZZ
MKNLGIKFKKYISIIFLITVLLISLLLSGYTYFNRAYEGIDETVSKETETVEKEMEAEQKAIKEKAIKNAEIRARIKEIEMERKKRMDKAREIEIAKLQRYAKVKAAEEVAKRKPLATMMNESTKDKRERSEQDDRTINAFLAEQKSKGRGPTELETALGLVDRDAILRYIKGGDYE